MRSLTAALPIIVSNYARMFGVEVRIQGVSAYTDGRVINIPRLDLFDPVKSRYAYAYLAHEAAHIRYTSFAAVKKAHSDFLRFAMFNVLEDARVERRISREFIGVWENLNLLRAQREPFTAFVRQAPQLPLLQALLGFLVSYVAVFCQEFPVQRPRAAALLKILRRRCRGPLLRRIACEVRGVGQLPDSAAVLRLGDKICRWLRSAPDFFARDCLPPPGRAPAFDPGRGDEAAGTGFEEQLARLTAGTHQILGEVAPGCDPKTVLNGCVKTETSSRDDFGVMAAGECVPGRADFINAAADTYGLRRILMQRVRAYREALGWQADSGRRINPRRAALIPLGEQRIFYRKLRVSDMATSLHVLVDVSGSMMAYDDSTKTRCEQACICALATSLALQGIDGVENQVTFFPGRHTEYEVALFPGQQATRAAPRFDQQPRGSTPLAQTLWYAAGLLHCKRNIIIVITDGIPDSIDQTRTVLRRLEELHTEVYGIGIRQDFIRDLIPRSRVIGSPDELNRALFTLLTAVFTLRAEQNLWQQG